jgi:hypothetical protein
MKMMGWSIVISYFVTAMPIGQNFALMALFWKKQWAEGTEFSGMLMSVGEVLGLACLIPLSMKSIFQLRILKPFRKPANLVCATFAVSCCLVAVLFESKWLNVIGLVSVHIINVLLHTFCNEILSAWMPSDVYPIWLARSYVAKRLSNTTMAFYATSVFMHVGHRAPFGITAAIVAMWGLLPLGMYTYLGLMPCQADPPVDELNEEARVMPSEN